MLALLVDESVVAVRFIVLEVAFFNPTRADASDEALLDTCSLIKHAPAFAAVHILKVDLVLDLLARA